MKKLQLAAALLIILSIALGACSPQQPAPTQATSPAPTVPPTREVVETAEPEPPAEDVLYLNLVWHQHQPLYYKNEDGVYTRPWVRVHATKDYYDMAYLVSQYPEVHVTFNLTPVLIRQINDFVENGAKDLYWVMAEKPAGQLTDADKRFLLERFFDANYDNIIGRFPRYQELLDRRGGGAPDIEAAIESFSEQDFRDLQVWFNLAWFDPMFLEQEPLKSLVDKGRDFTEEDKAVVFDQVREVMAEVIPLHAQMQASGQIEVITTPYAHPILPLLIDSNLASAGSPGADLPVKFSYPNDALVHLEKSVELYEENFGQAPRGLWPGEGSVAQAMVPFVLRAGYQWMGTGEPVLAKSLGIESFTRDSKETVNQADLLYRPYYVTNQAGDRLAVFFRDGVLSDKIGFTYSGTPGEAAAADLMQRLENIRARLKEQGAEGPHVVSIILDGENAWEYYPNDGIEFLSAMYRMLSESETIKTVTPSEYLEMFPEQEVLEDLFPAAWFSPNYETWIGEQEENVAWEYLRQTREVLAKYEQGVRDTDPDSLALAQDFMYLAEGSDWFWWYGSDQDSGQDQYFDIGYRALLRGVFESLGEPVPTFVDIPVIQAAPVSPATALQGLSTPVVDGQAAEEEWASAAVYPIDGAGTVQSLAYTLDAQNLYLRVEAAEGQTLSAPVGFFFNAPRTTQLYPFSLDEEPSLLGIAASHAFVWDGGSGLSAYTSSAEGWVEADTDGQAAASGSVLELAIPFAEFGELDTGDELRMVVTAAGGEEILPAGGPAQVVIPDRGLSELLFEVEDPAGDDHGPGTYTYPTDSVFQANAFDLKSFQVLADENNLIFKIAFNGPIPNPWGSPNNLAIQTLDVYIDQDPGAGTGARLLLPGRNAALEEGNGWDVALWAEGWTPQVVAPDSETLEPKQMTAVEFRILVDPGARTVTLRVPRDLLAGDPSQWGYVVAVMGQEGYPSAGVWRIRDVEERAAQWRFGGAPADTNHTRIIDLIWPEGVEYTQEDMLSIYPSSTADPGSLTANDFAQIPLLRP